jgi:hypothetical protein
MNALMIILSLYSIRFSSYICSFILFPLLQWEHAVALLVEALRYKPEGQWIFFIDIILPAALWPWV